MNSETVESMYQQHGLPVPKKIKVPHYGGKPKFVKPAPGDTGDFLPPIFFEDPHKHQPEPGPLGEVHAWGLYSYVDDSEEYDMAGRTDDLNWPAFDGVNAMMRQMKAQMMYNSFAGGFKDPEHQFMKVILDHKRQQLKTMDITTLGKPDVLVRVYIAQEILNKPLFYPSLFAFLGPFEITRESHESGANSEYQRGFSSTPFRTKYSALSWDRFATSIAIPSPIFEMGLSMVQSSSIDKMHIAQVGYDFLPDDKYKLAHLFGKEGDRIGYLYDFGDKWFHNIEIVKIYPVEQSTGEIVILDGNGMCPGENMNGSLQYADFLKEYEKGTVTQKYKKKKEILETPNYKAFGKPPSQFDPFGFDIQAARDRLAEALGTTNSVRSGAKQFSMPIAPGAQNSMEQRDSKWLKKGQKIVTNYDDKNWGYWHETASSSRDKTREAVCASCGKPATKNSDFKKCSGCRQVMYCSPEHQKAHWKAGHKRHCTREFVNEDATSTTMK
ncbi:hypothetical protein CPB83DRAFT_897543 [Crepidotus variabilis]|uniref:MYND-type domain-containing protein n=1 Tax=Crepidotus variabilis TaxID=179855 RepID=A0A9P6E8V8_9AGAR|nr:hypothetical protein CPB83DRAFT_897543 [Crepidotus variabilis]